MDPVIDLTLRAALSLLLLAAASHKARDLARFRATLADYRLLPGGLVSPGAAVVVGVEAAVAAALLAPALRAPGLLAAAALLVVYGAAIGINLARGRRHIDCGCAGPAVRRPISGWLVARNAALAALALAGLVPVRPRALVWMDALTVVGGTALLAAVYASLDRMIADAPALARLRSGG
jgi:hypothetical protein